VKNFVTICLRVYILQEVKVPVFPYESDVAVITVMRYRAACDIERGNTL